MTDQSSHFPKFYMTAPSPCPYLKGRIERKIFTELNGQKLSYDKKTILQHRQIPDIKEYAENLHHSLTLVGFRRSQDIAYRPACDDCYECKSSRVPVAKFSASKSQRRILKKNIDITATIKENIATTEQYQLLDHYINSRHADGGMAGITYTEYQEMVECSPITSHIIEYRQDDNKLIAAALMDELIDGFSMVYSFFDISDDIKKRSLGVYMVLNQIQLAKSLELDYVYLGYLVKNSVKMNYKINFQPLEILYSNGWKIMA